MDLDLYERYFHYLMKESDLYRLYEETKKYCISPAYIDDMCIKHICKAIEIMDTTMLTNIYAKEEKAKETSHYIY